MDKKADRNTKSNGQGQGMNWLRPVKRLAIYLRDGLACVYCGHSLETGAKLTLDHLKPYSKGGGNEATNLVTCCNRCNSARGNRSVALFTKAVAGYLNGGVKPADILKHVRNSSRRTIDTSFAKQVMENRSSFSEALNSLK